MRPLFAASTRSWLAAVAACGGSHGRAPDAATRDTVTFDAVADAMPDGGSTDAASVICLAPTTFASSFAIADSAFCAVAVYTASEALGAGTPTWGRHGGPLTLTADSTGGGLTLKRWTPPAASTGAMTVQTTHVAAAVPTNSFIGTQAVDLPFFGWTALSWSDATTSGAFELVAGGAVAISYTVNGPDAAAGVPDATSQGRFLYTGRSLLGTTATAINGLYAADACAAPTQELGAGTGCGAPILVAAWGDTAGPLAVDGDENLFAVLARSSTGAQEARGFTASAIGRGAPVTMGTALFTLPGIPISLAALAPTATSSGTLAFQGFDSTTFQALDVVEQAYTVASSVAAVGTPQPLLVLTTAQRTSGVAVMTDPAGRLWVAAPDASSTRYVVLVRHP